MNARDDSDYTGPDAGARKLLGELEGILHDVRNECAVIGGMAYNFWREPRFTKDVDLTLAADAAIFARVRERMLEAGYELRRIQDEDEPSGPGFARFIQPGTSKIVEFLTAKTEFQEQLIKRAVAAGDGESLRIATPEDIIVLKLIANRPQDQVDAISLGLIEGLDWDYIEHWCGIWDISDRFEGFRGAVSTERQRLTDLYADDPSQRSV